MASEKLLGWDPYDALTSPIFRLPLLRSNWLLRFGAQQVVLRFPINLRPLLRTPRQLNAVTVGLYIQGLADLAAAGSIDHQQASNEVSESISRLEQLRSPGWSGSCWGYPFPWEGRRGAHRTEQNFPTVVATGMIVNGLHNAWKVFGTESARELIVDSARFVLDDLQHVDGDDQAWCWSYSPADHQAVVNATMKGSRLIAQAVDAGFDEPGAIEAATSSARWAAQQQQADGGWPYAVAGDPRSWRDSFHTGYILECYDTYRSLTGNGEFDETIERGWQHYRSTFFTDEALPKYFDKNPEPLDPTAAGQALLTLVAFGDTGFAASVSTAVVEQLGNADGSFRYRPRGARGRAGGVHYIRWSTAWMFAGLTSLVRAEAGKSSP